MSLHTQHLPTVLHNLKATKGVRVQDLVNWHRIVKPLRAIVTEEATLDVGPLIFTLFTRFTVAYQPAKGAPPTRRPAHRPSTPGQPKVALFVDAPEHLSGVAVTIGNWATQAMERDLNLTIHTAGRGSLPRAVEFQPMGTFELKNYAGMRLHVPHVDEVMNYMREADFDRIHISTPGPMGLIALLAARTLGIPVSGTYHTDFPRYSVKLCGDEAVEEGCWKFMRWFYGQMDAIACPSMGTLIDLKEHGFHPSKLAVVGRGVRADLFHPLKRSEELRNSWDTSRPHKLLYVGRVSEEKNLDCLIYSFQQLCQERDDTELIVVGDGPYRDTMMAKLQGFPARFPGRKTGDELQRIFASCDLFAFPSETDTFGVVLIEAQASGLPVVVSAKGGTQYAMQKNITGTVVDEMTPFSLAAAIRNLLDDPEGYNAMKSSARAFAEDHTQEKAFETYWNFLVNAVPHSEETAV